MNDTEPEVSVFRLDRPGIRKVLGDLEAEIMEFIWGSPPGEGTTVRDVFEVLYARRRIAYTTVMSTMARLAKKNLLGVERDDQAYVYYPKLSQEEFISRFVGHVLEDLMVSFADATFNELGTLSDPQVAARAQQLLEEIARRRTVEEGE